MVDLQRFVVVGLDPKKADFASCTFHGLKEAGSAVRQYEKLGVTPVLIDLTRVIPNTMRATASPSVSLPSALPTADNPTAFRLPRWLLLSRGADGVVSFDVAADYAAAKGKVWDLSKRGREAALVSVNSALMTDRVPANIGDVPLPPRVDVDVSSPTIAEMRLPRQFVVAVPDPEGPYDAAASDGIVGLEGHRWKSVVGEFDDSAAAFAAAKGRPDAIIYDRDNDYRWGPPWDAPATVQAFGGEAAYLKFERWAIERDIRTAVNNRGTDTVAGIIAVLRTTPAPLRRSGQTGWDRAEDWVSHASRARRAEQSPGGGQGDA